MAYINKLSSGNFQVHIRLKGLKPIYRTFSTQALAKQFARQVEGDTELQRKLGNPVANTLLFSDAVSLYLSQITLRDQSAPSRILYWKRRFHGVAVNQIDEFMVDEALHELAKTRSGSTVNRYKSHLSAVYTFLIRHPSYKRMGLENPVLKASVSRFKENPAKDRFLSLSEQDALLRASQQSRWPRLYLLIMMALTTGARKGELLSLKWSDIDFKDRVASVRQTKTDKPRLLPLTGHVVQELMRFREVDDALIFRNTISSDKPYDLKQAWSYALVRSGIEHCRFHDLRHTAASNLVRAGRTLFEVGTLLGHSSPQMTKRYAHLAITDTLKMVDEVMGELK